MSKKENRIIVAKSQNYDNHGLLDNSDKTAVLLPEGSGNDWRWIAYANMEDLPELCVAKRTGNMKIREEQTGQLRFA